MGKMRQLLQHMRRVWTAAAHLSIGQRYAPICYGPEAAIVARLRLAMYTNDRHQSPGGDGTSRELRLLCRAADLQRTRKRLAIAAKLRGGSVMALDNHRDRPGNLDLVVRRGAARLVAQAPSRRSRKCPSIPLAVPGARRARLSGGHRRRNAERGLYRAAG
ncbi:hypothetical protein SBBP2_1080013 [Burkholderiales bacterium]|nr:hypothetical protein SBBP2_1080013 [Burkholderiales bacterium]